MSQSQRDSERPTPEELLARYHLRNTDLAQQNDNEHTSDPQQPLQKEHGRLRVYLGAVAGSGKTYAMLAEGHRRQERRTDVVIGYVETHQRQQTIAQVRDLEIISRKKVFYRGVMLEEMDTDAIIQRAPRVALVDELAHSNAPGSKNRKRYQDIQEIQNAGIDVISTLNIQHLESLNDIVASITGIQVRETIPDRVLDQADEVELIDIAPYALRQRMRHGNIYPPERIETALNNFFREGNLTALRELALRRTAEKAEAQLQQYMNDHHIHESWETHERVLVGFDHRTQSRQILRDAWKLAHGLHADLIAVSVTLEGYPAWINRMVAYLKYGVKAKAQNREAQRRLSEYKLLAEDLGADVIHMQGPNIAAAIAKVAREHHVTQIVLGQPTRSRWEEIFRSSVVNQLIQFSRKIDIYLVPLERPKRKEGE